MGSPPTKRTEANGANARAHPPEFPRSRTMSKVLAPLTSTHVHERLPSRVTEKIRDQQTSSEILIGWIQLAVFCTWAVLYMVAPKTFDPLATFAPVPWALGVYLTFTVIRLALAHARRLPDWLRSLSVVFDIILLLVMIWSFHLQYDQPASFYLKAPTLLYVFIFIALRTLNFEVRYVLLCGLVAAAGWLLMVLYVVVIDPADSMVTHDYVEYMTSNSVLIGAEFDKIISILMVTGILAIGIVRSRSLLISSVVDSTVAEELSRFVPTEVAEQLTTSETAMQAGDGETREASVMFVDIEDFTGFSEILPPEQLIATLNEYFKAIAQPIAAHGGVINQFQGDAVLATFNLPRALEDHAARALTCAIDIQRLLGGHTFNKGVRFQARIGINTGIILGGLVGTGERLSYTVHGDEVNLAARLEQLNKDYGTRIACSKHTRDLAGVERFAFDKLGSVKVRGRQTPVTAYSVKL